MADGRNIEDNVSTQEKIKEAARRVFTRKGFAATRTRDIAEESGFNLALLNYYFRSKENLFNIIMLEQLQLFLHSVLGLLNDPESSLQTKIEIIVSHYIDMLIENPDLPVFILSELKGDPEKLISRAGFPGKRNELFIVKQWGELMASGKLPQINPVHFMINLLSLMIFPFIGSPLLRNRMNLDMVEFKSLMEERKKLIPFWIKTMLTTPMPDDY